MQLFLLLTLTTMERVKRLAVCLCVIPCVRLSVCPHDKIKTAEIKITKLGTRIVHYESSSSN